MKTSEDIKELATALAKAQGEIKGALKDTANIFFKSKYADLASVWDACRSQLSSNGLSIVQTADYIPELPDHVIIETQLNHSSGQWIRGSIIMKPVKTDPQATLSCITYARRASLAAMVGVAPEDDDGNAASGKANDKDYSQAIEKWKSDIVALSEKCTIESFRAYWPDHKATVLSECGQSGAADVYKLYIEIGKKLAGAV